MNDPIMRITGVSLDALVVAFMGGVASMVFVAGGAVPRTISLICGVVASIYLSPWLIIVARALSPGGGEQLERAVVFMTGFLGMLFLAGCYGVVARLRDRASKVADEIIRKID